LVLHHPETVSIDDKSTANRDAVGMPPKSFDSNKKDIKFGDFDHSHILFEDEKWPVIIIGSNMVGMMTGFLFGYHEHDVVWITTVIILLTLIESRVYHAIVISHPARIQSTWFELLYWRYTLPAWARAISP
jgi:hypothetical protein